MTIRLLSLVAIVATGSGAMDIAAAQPAVSGRLLLSSDYDFRGVPQNERGVIQPELGIELPASARGAVALTTWGNIDLSDDVGSAVLPGGSGGHFSEIDFSVTYSHRVGPTTMAAGVTSYNFPGGGSPTSEVHAAVSGHLLGLSSHVSVFRDVDLVRGLYVNGGVTRADALGGGLSSVLSMTVGLTDGNHAEGYYGVRDSGLADVLAGVFIGYSRGHDTTLGIDLRYSTLLDADKRDALREAGLESGSFAAGLSVAREF